MIGIGVDIEKTDRFKKKLKDKRFLNKIFTQEELNYCFSNKYPEKHLAARFAGKEAMIKAYCSLYKDILDFKSIEIINNKKGVPEIKLLENSKKSCKLLNRISLSHTDDNVVAFVQIEENNENR